MTIEELYQQIGGDYEQAQKVLRMDKLIDKYIRKLAQNEIFSNLFNASEGLDPTAVFEAAHAIKGVCANLGLVSLSEKASELAEEFRPGNGRNLSDEDVRARIEEIKQQFNSSVEGIKEYEASQS